MSGMVAKIGLPVMAQDIRDFTTGGRLKEALAPAMTDADAAYPGGITSSDKRSSGLGVARIVCAATCV